jgi:hypothetical protein
VALTLQQILTPQTSAQIRAQMVTTLQGLGVPANQWAATGVASTILTVAATVLSLFSNQISNFVAGFFLPTATGGLLQLLAQYVYGVTVPQATFASGSYLLTNIGGGVYPYAAGAFQCQNAVTGQTYTNPVGFTIPASSTLTIQIQATTAGTVGNANPGDISVIVTSALGVTGTNPASVVGLDPPTDAAIRQLCLNSLGARSVRGPRTAYAYAIQVALNTVTGNPVNINRWTVSSDSHTGDVSVVVASPSGTPDPNDVAGVVVSIEANARPDAVTVTTSGASVVPYSPVVTPWVIAPVGVSAAQLQTAIATAITNFLDGPQSPIGGNAAADDAHPLGFSGVLGPSIIGAAAIGVATIPDCTLVSLLGATDLGLTPTQVASDGVTVALPRIIPLASS